MSGVNKAIIVGNLGQDPETRHMPNGGSVCNISVATSEKWKDKNTGQPQERTEWHKVVFFNRLAEIAGQYLRKGSKVYVEGSLRTRKWQDQSGQDRYTTEVVAKEMQMLDSRGGGQQQGGGYPEQQGGYQPQQQAPQHGGYPPPHQAPQQPQGGWPEHPQSPHLEAPQNQAPPADYDDDIPF